MCEDPGTQLLIPAAIRTSPVKEQDLTRSFRSTCYTTNHLSLCLGTMMKKPLRLLIIEDNDDDAELEICELREQGFEPYYQRVDTPQKVEAALRTTRWDAIIADYNMPSFTGLEALRIVQATGLDIPFLLVSGTISEALAVEAMQAGAHDYIMKHNLTRLAPAIERELLEVRVRRDHHQALEALRVSEERFQLAMQGANDGLWDWDVKQDRMYYSPRWKSMLGYADEELEDHFDTWKRLVHPQDRERTLALVNEFMEGHAGTFEIEYRMRHKKGHYLDILSRGFPIYDEHGKAVRMVGTHVDVTDSNKLEQQYRQAQKMEAVGQLAGGVAHDFNNILTAITGYAHLILDQVQDNDAAKSSVEEIIKASKRAAALTKALLAFSRKQTVTLAVIDLSEALKGFEELLRRLIREDIELKISCTEKPLPVMADRGQIEQVLMNLVANARDAMPHGGKICIETSPVSLDHTFVESHGYGKVGEYALLAVSDSGVGLDKETQSHIFEPFFTTKEQGKGTGLGLSMAYGIVKKHDGFINVYSEPGKGTIFKIYLPRVQATAQAAKTETKKAAALHGGRETILVCEDEEALRRLSTKVLSHYGYHVIEAVDGQDALDKFSEHKDKIKLVILDAIMPKKNGKEACQVMKTVRPDLKTIFASGYTQDVFKDGSIFDENTIFIHKPFSPNVLLEKVREMLDKK